MLWEKQETNVYRSKYICTNDLRESDGLFLRDTFEASEISRDWLRVLKICFVREAGGVESEQINHKTTRWMKS